MASVDELWAVDPGEPYPPEPARHRPALVVGPAPEFGTEVPFVIVCPLTITYRGLPAHVEIDPESGCGLDELSYVQCELIRSIGRGRLVHRIRTLDAERSFVVHNVLKMLLGH